jgi:hypothetical protein
MKSPTRPMKRPEMDPSDDAVQRRGVKAIGFNPGMSERVADHSRVNLTVTRGRPGGHWPIKFCAAETASHSIRNSSIDLPLNSNHPEVAASL